MRMPRNSTRRLMAVVAASSVLLGGWVEYPRLRGRADAYRARARMLAAREKRYQRLLSTEFETRAYWSARAADWSQRAKRAGPHESPTAGSWTDLAAQATLLADCRASQIARLGGNVRHYARLRRKYEDAAVRPWLPVWPDPPPPE